MPEDNRGLRQTFGPGGGDEVDPHHLHNTRARQPGNERRTRKTEGQRGEENGLGRTGAQRRQELQTQRHYVDEHQPEPEGRHRDPERGDQHRDVVDPRIRFQTGDNTQRQPEKDGHPQPGQCQADRMGQLLEQHLGDGTVAAERPAEIAVQDAPQVRPELHVERPVESQLVTKILQHLVGDPASRRRSARRAHDHGAHGISGEEVLHGKDGKGHAEKHRNRQQGAAQGKPGQREFPFNAGNARGDSRPLPASASGSQARRPVPGCAGRNYSTQTL